jgi:hypothetical protein
MKTFRVILEYCGGPQTDHLFERLQSWNSGCVIDVLDNASPSNRCSCITYQNTKNLFVGGGIIDCYRLAEEHNCDNLFLVVNDIEPLTPIVIEQFERELAKDPSLVQVTASLTSDSTPQATIYPWMVVDPSQRLRSVPHSDLLCCIIRPGLIRSFDRFPPSRGGWGYDWEIAHQARLQKLRIATADWCVVRHEDKVTAGNAAASSKCNKYGEMLTVYRSRYPQFEFALDHTIVEYWRQGSIQFAAGGTVGQTPAACGIGGAT